MDTIAQRLNWWSILLNGAAALALPSSKSSRSSCEILVRVETVEERGLAWLFDTVCAELVGVAKNQN